MDAAFSVKMIVTKQFVKMQIFANNFDHNSDVDEIFKTGIQIMNSFKYLTMNKGK